MSSLIKQKRISNKSLVVISLCITLALALGLGTLVAFALTQVSFNSSIKISYQAVDINGSVTMYAKAAPKSAYYTATPEAEKVGEFAFTTQTDTTETPAEINIDETELTSTNNTLYLHYVFENTGTRAYTAILNYAQTDILVQQNITLAYSESGAEGTYKSANSGLVVPGNGTKHYYVTVSVTDLAFNAEFEGMFTWQLNECDQSLTAMEELSLTATEFTLISEEDNTYSASYNGGDISISGLTSQENGIENIWYVPARIGSGRVVSIICSGEDKYGDQIFLPDNTKVVIANGVEEIGFIAFSPMMSGCGIVEIDIPNSVTSIGESAFEACFDLRNVNLGSGVINIENYAFWGASITSIEMPNCLTNIGMYAFGSCLNLKVVTIPNSVISIGDSAFDSCSSLTSVTIGSGVTGIGENAFGSTNLETININSNAYFQWGYIFPSLKDATKQVTVNLGNNVTMIVESAFASCYGLSEINFGTGLPIIEVDAFYDCSGLTEVVIPDSVEYIGATAFSNTGIERLVIGSGVTSLDSFAFIGNQNLREVVIKEGLQSIGPGTFQGCDKLESISIPDSVVYIEYAAFYNCSSLTNVTLGNGVTYIGEGAFGSCTSLTQITIPKSVVSMGNIADMPFVNCTNLTSVIFEDPNGWEFLYYVDIEDDYGNYIDTEYFYEEISADILSDPTTAAARLVTDNSCGWEKTSK